MSIGSGDIMQMTAYFTCRENTYANVYHWVLADRAGMSDPDIIDSMLLHLEDLYLELNGAINEEIAYDSVKIVNLTDETIEYEGPWPTLETGGGEGELMPQGVSPLVTLYTAVMGCRGRKFFPPVCEENVVAGVWTPALVGGLVLAATYLTGTQSIFGGALVQFGVKSLKTGLFAAFNEALIRDVPSYQRRRKPGVGE